MLLCPHNQESSLRNKYHLTRLSLPLHDTLCCPGVKNTKDKSDHWLHCKD